MFTGLAENAERAIRTERLVLRRLLGDLVRRSPIVDADLTNAMRIVNHWADMERSGRLRKIQETQLQGDFLRDIFGEVLGYKRLTEGEERWELEQHRSFGAQTPDASIGRFSAASGDPVAIIELKGPRVHLDRDRSQGRTAVQQCWDYLASVPKARWGIVSNIVSFRLYERAHTPRRYEHFSLQELRNEDTLRRFYAMFGRYGLLQGVAGQRPAMHRLLDETDNRQRTVGDELYSNYSRERLRLIQHLHQEKDLTIDDAVGAAQRLLDRIIFIAFCEDRGLLPDRTIDRAYHALRPFTKATNPRWSNFVELFRAVDSGTPNGDIPAYNGGLFSEGLIDTLDLDDKWTTFFWSVGEYDFGDEVNLDVLGHLFEKSVTELERLREGDLFGEAADADRYAQMPQSAKRKRMGVYYTPPDFTRKISELTVDALIAERFGEQARRLGLEPADADTVEHWRACLDVLLDFRVVDPACGSGAFLFQAYETLESRYMEVIGQLKRHGVVEAEELIERIPDSILTNNLYGVDLSPEAIEITQLALWIRTARRGSTLSNLSHNIRCGNSLVSDPDRHPRAFDWREEFPEVFRDREPGGFDAVIGNPPWERMKLQEREFFALSAPQIATASNAATRRRLIAELEKSNPELYASYRQAGAEAEAQYTHCRTCGEYPLTGKGDVNTYSVFAELASRIVSPRGRVGLLVPSGIVSDNTTRHFFGMLAESKRLHIVYDFENKRPYFEDVHRSFKFCILGFGGAEQTREAPEFVFFAHDIEELSDAKRRIPLSAADIALMNPNSGTCPVFRTRRDADLTRAVYQRVPVLIRKDGNQVTNYWGIRFQRMFDQTNDAEHFQTPDDLKSKRYRLEGNRYVKGKHVFLPLYEGKMVQSYDHRASSVELQEANWMRQGQTVRSTDVEHQDSQYVPLPRYWVDQGEALERLGSLPVALLGFKDITSPTNQRTMISSFAPLAGFTNHFVLVRTDAPARSSCCLLANFNSYIFDFIARQKIGGVTLNFFIVEQLPVLPPFKYDERCPWSPKETLRDWISERVLKLTCTAIDMLPLAEAADFTGGDAEGGRLNRWKNQERPELLADLDAAYFILYGIEREDAEYILSTFRVAGSPAPGLPGVKSIAEHTLDAYDWLRSQCF
ncbi:MAG: hypothetical protein EA376_03985 [Phycisphaeraceae bacterium]|nr:MAG: hypothetical protein EA376_03985 [Phycisphaeraceae bacterium]